MAFLMILLGVVWRDLQKLTSDFFCRAVTLKVITLNLSGFRVFLAFFRGMGSAFVNNVLEVTDDLFGQVLGLFNHIAFGIDPDDRLGI